MPRKNTSNNVFKIVKSAGDTIFEGRPFDLVKTKKNKAYVKTLVTKCGVTEANVHKILAETLEAGAIFRDIAGGNNEGSATAATLLDGYTKALDGCKKAIEALENIARHNAVVADQTFLGSLKAETQPDIDALKDCRDALKKRRAEWAALYLIKTKHEPKNLTAMLVNQVFCLCNYIEKCHVKAGLKYKHIDAHEFIAELFRAIYHDPFFEPARFTQRKIKQYYDNSENHYKDLRKSHPRK